MNRPGAMCSSHHGLRSPDPCLRSMLPIETVLTMEAMLASDTLLVDLALILCGIGIWMELNPRQRGGPPEAADHERRSGAIAAILLLAIMMLPESSFWSSPGRALVFLLVFAALAWRRNALIEARHRVA